MLYRHVFDKISTKFRVIFCVFVNFAGFCGFTWISRLCDLTKYQNPVWLCCWFTAGLKNSLNLLIEINKQQTTDVARSPVFLAYSLQQAKANNKSVTWRLAPLAYNNAYKKFLEQRYNVFCLILHSWRLRFLSQWASAWYTFTCDSCIPSFRKLFTSYANRNNLQDLL